MNPGSSLDREEKKLFYLALGLSFLASMAAVWGVPLLPMQDAPHHIFESMVLSTYDDPSYNWKDYYQAGFTFGPYSLLYNLLWFFMKFLSPVGSGKMFVTLSLFVTLYLAVKIARESPEVKSPWPLLLVFPLFFTHMYYYGFMPILLGAPVTLLLLSDVENLKKRNYSPKEWCVTGILLYALFASHPSSILAFFLLGSLSSLSALPDKRGFWRSLAPAAALLVCFAIWYLVFFRPADEATGVPATYFWRSFSGNLASLILPFTGMKLFNGISFPDLILWLLIFFGALFLVFREREEVTKPGSTSLFLAVSVAWFLLMPFRFGRYAFFNVRMSPYVYWFLALLLTRLRLSRQWGATLLAVCLALTGLTWKRNLDISSEKEELLPLLSLMEKNRLLMPVKFNPYSRHIDSDFFDIHVHDPIYYHLLVGGGADTNLFLSPMRPVSFKKDSMFAEDFEPRVLYDFDENDPEAYTIEPQYARALANWSGTVDYLLIRGKTDRLISYLSDGFTLPVRQNGMWFLIARDQSLLRD
ncbi:hypothetical protein EPN96_10090 [bacterium]|nr:MAG: hypothetical protein EPN96_10090 [bacterium]